ncbi:MAG: (d)CMP kinase [Candidatus Midichloria mitochondrii]|uniref:Cytidylate kinase n=1 Tax=Midichloria mitochondrii (strain IricVA) TaxID=696127 RepID=F7XW35_MIDMI|nr:(d)CMP kinase [Candidatus Midichloria mitochondrii]AEI88884.1 cytidylate kinase [Candidatus Midichloria mitochondrii IricVA]MDJ1256097.1 (d)CMP kinase [Candidatus Midichloria mitochondrii]MDJ1287779.1 (d)CMP kinase [Candidatus Midichloria mitochondrii]MDJ1298618.1 (d)CMP kinase [Candidatus Midichloria mitochondrii]MDJ1312830.1 (d)CMP kinase [Candidatus Midichloria mitochondrii]
MSFVIAIDGPAASGKGTIAKIVAEKLGFDYLNTGLLYRAVAYFALQNQIELRDTDKLVSLIDSINFNDTVGTALYGSVVSENASVIAAIPEVRKALLGIQRTFAIGKEGVVIEGRDIGTVIFPNANVKIYITADIEERAARRFKQLQKNGEDIIYDDVLRDLQIRDLRDSSRNNAPLTKGSDYLVVDTTKVDIDAAVDSILKLINRAL